MTDTKYKNESIKLNIGCGNNILKDWINIDSGEQFGQDSLDVVYDLSKGIPFEDNSVDYIYNEHFIEHLNKKEGIKFFKDSYRVLKSSGVMRIACPDLQISIQTYINDSYDSMDWINLICPSFKGKSRCELFNIEMREWGHKYIYDKEELTANLAIAGFAKNKITSETIYQSHHKELQNLETRTGSIIMECIK